jgi:hypothetical protein
MDFAVTMWIKTVFSVPFEMEISSCLRFFFFTDAKIGKGVRLL